MYAGDWIVFGWGTQREFLFVSAHMLSTIIIDVVAIFFILTIAMVVRLKASVVAIVRLFGFTDTSLSKIYSLIFYRS